MMSAYFSDFAHIDPGTICTWIFQLENKLSQTTNNKDSQNLSLKYVLFIVRFLYFNLWDN